MIIIPSEPHDDMTLGEAKLWLSTKVDKGVRCPCCNRYGKIYRRHLNAGMAISLIRLYQRAGQDYAHIPTVIDARSREEAKMRWWGLLEDEGALREDGGRAGWWRVTERGKRFVYRELWVPKYALEYQNTLLQLCGPYIDIVDSLGSNFNYDELMRGE